jgi:hypothetical protein
MERRTVTLRGDSESSDFRALWAYLDDGGALHIDGQDFGPATSAISGDGEYEYFLTVAPEHVLEFVTLLGGKEVNNVLDFLIENYVGERSYELERALRASQIPFSFFAC